MNEILGTLAAYGIIITPSIISIFGIVLSVIKAIKSATETKSAVDTIKAEAIASFDQIKSSNEFKELKNLCADIMKENKVLKKSLIECTEALTRIRNNHPELFSKEE